MCLHVGMCKRRLGSPEAGWSYRQLWATGEGNSDPLQQMLRAEPSLQSPQLAPNYDLKWGGGKNLCIYCLQRAGMNALYKTEFLSFLF